MLGESCRLSTKLDSLVRNGNDESGFPRSAMQLAFPSISAFDNFLITFPFCCSATVPHGFPIYIGDQTGVRGKSALSHVGP